ncbi:MAG TPA: glucose-6-phosphate dehydrogenase, partial [Niallia sp.]|nr:glucose-6-phosphate dehydrogenase [Niallia sp.]
MEPLTFVLFGATGDLAKRKIFPALYNLFIDRKTPDPISIIALGRREVSNENFQSYVKKSIESYSRRVINDQARMNQFLESIHYQVLDANNVLDYKNLLDKVQQREKELHIPENRMFYLSVGPEFFEIIASNITNSGLGNTKGWKRLIIEKPFGHDLVSARQLNKHLTQSFKEEEIYRIDHYLGKPMVQNLEALEFANPVLQSIWNNKHIANVQITASELVGVEERAGYYDQAGAIRDMVQNHMLQMVMMTAMHVPQKISAKNIREEKSKVLQALRPIEKEDIQTEVVRGQYCSGMHNGEYVVGYRDEPNVKTDSNTDTFFAARLWIDNELWRGVPFYIRTGKRMQEKSTRIVIEFKNTLKGLYQENIEPNLLIIEINPNENITLQLNSKNSLENGKMEQVKVNFTGEQKGVPEAYERLIYDAFQGDSTFFAHWNEVELAWKWVQPLLEAFDQNTLPLHFYAAGSTGPEASD